MTLKSRTPRERDRRLGRDAIGGTAWPLVDTATAALPATLAAGVLIHAGDSRIDRWKKRTHKPLT